MSESAPFTIAIVDDDDSIRRLVRLYLERNGYTVMECSNGREARELLRDHSWDLAILDRKLPDLDGLDLCLELKGDAENRGRYVIVLTGEDEPAEKLEGFELGADDYVTKPFEPLELMARIRAAKRIIDLQKELIATNRRLERLSITDGLTQLFNHRHFQEELARTFEESVRYGRPLSLALIDIDHFKKINDTWGHAVGDEVLKNVSSIFSRSVRATDLVARYGGEEFVVMMPETELDDARQFAEKIRSLVEQSPTRSGEQTVVATISIGIATVPHPRLKSPIDLIESADRGLYAAKREGRNRTRLDPEEGRKPGPSPERRASADGTRR